MFRRVAENHLIGRTGWLRAVAPGANVGIISTASPIVGVAAAANSLPVILTVGAGAVVGRAV